MWNSLSEHLKVITEEAEEEVDGEEVEKQKLQGSYDEGRIIDGGQEIERYKRELFDVYERLRISELQTMDISKEYRRLLIEKEEEVKELKSQNILLEARHSELQSQNNLISSSPDEKTKEDVELEVSALKTMVEQYKQSNELLQQKLQQGNTPSEKSTDEGMRDSFQEATNALKVVYEGIIQDLKVQLDRAQQAESAVSVDETQERLGAQQVAFDSIKVQLASLAMEREIALKEKNQVREMVQRTFISWNESDLVGGVTLDSANDLVETVRTLIDHVNQKKRSGEGEGCSDSGNLNSDPTSLQRTNSFDTTAPQYQQLQQQLEKAQKDLGRLRLHLVELEENHTLSEVEASERIAALEQKLQGYEKREEVNSKREVLVEELRNELRSKDDELARSATAVSNLQTVLELFQANQEETIIQETKHLKNELLTLKGECDKLKKENTVLRDSQKRCVEAEGRVMSLMQEITDKTRAYVKLQEEFNPLRQALDHTLAKLADVSQNEQNLVDKRVVNQLLMKYFTPGSNRTEVLSLMARILNFNDDQKLYVGLSVPGQQKGWLGFLKGSGGVPPGSIIREEKNITDLWIEFLMKEAEKGVTSSSVDDNSNSNNNKSDKTDSGNENNGTSNHIVKGGNDTSNSNNNNDTQSVNDNG